MQDDNQQFTDGEQPQSSPPPSDGFKSDPGYLEPSSATVQDSQTPTSRQTKKPKKEAGILSFIATLAIAFILVQIINAFFFQSYKVFGSSMVPTLHDGDRLIISKLGKTSATLRGKNYAPNRGDIIVFVDPLRSDLQLIKRVIGLPGERVIVKDGKITIYNGDYPKGFNPDTSGAYQADLPTTSGETNVQVPPNHLFVSGDNRAGSNSLDSRNELGTVPQDLVIGMLQVRIWPLDDAKFF